MNKKSFADQARTWIGTKFLHQGRLKKNENCQGGCDCLGLLTGIIKELSLEEKICKNIDHIDTKDYQRIIRTPILIENMRRHFKEKNLKLIEVGDIALFKFRNSIHPHHIGIISEVNEQLTLIHSFLNAGAVVEHLLDSYWIENIHSIYEIP